MAFLRGNQMPIEGYRARGLLLLTGMLVILLSSTACRLTVEEQQQPVEPQRTAMSVGVGALPEFDAAVSAIDFDPPLPWDSLLTNRRPVKLLAAVENNGTRPLYDLVVEARLSSQQGEFSARDQLKVARLAPGETKVVEFGRMMPATALPRSPSYTVRVTVGGGQRDAHPENNNHEISIRVSD